MLLNTDKNAVLSFTKYNSNHELSNELANITDNTKLLGIYIDNKLTWNIHIDHVCKKLRPGISALYSLRDSLPKTDLISIYYS